MKQLKKIYWKRIGVIGISCFMLLWSCLLTGCGIGKGDSGKPAACTISIDCQTILDNIGDLKETKKEFVPEDGWILPEMEVKFTTGDTVFDILKSSLPNIPRYIKAIMWKASISFMNLTAEKILAGCTV